MGVNARYSEFSGVVNIGDFINPASEALNQLIGQSRFRTNVSATLPLRQETKLELTQPLFNDALFGARAAARAQRDLVGATRKAALRQLAADIQQVSAYEFLAGRHGRHGRCCDVGPCCAQVHRGRAGPVAGGTRPACRLLCARRLIRGVTLREDGDVPAGMPIIRRDTPNRAVLMVIVVPRDEVGDPGACGLDIVKRLRGKREAVRERAKQRLGVRMVVVHARPAEGGNHAESFQGAHLSLRLSSARRFRRAGRGRWAQWYARYSVSRTAWRRARRVASGGRLSA